MSFFDPADFFNQTQEGGFETKRRPVPAGEYVAVSSVTPKSFRTTNKGQTILDILWKIDGDERVKEATGLDSTVVRQSIFLDVTEHGTLDRGTGKNVELGRTLEALGLNNRNWSFTELDGKPAKIEVTTDPDPRDPENFFNNVKRVKAL